MAEITASDKYERIQETALNVANDEQTILNIEAKSATFAIPEAECDGQTPIVRAEIFAWYGIGYVYRQVGGQLLISTTESCNVSSNPTFLFLPARTIGDAHASYTVASELPSEGKAEYSVSSERIGAFARPPKQQIEMLAKARLPESGTSMKRAAAMWAGSLATARRFHTVKKHSAADIHQDMQYIWKLMEHAGVAELETCNDVPLHSGNQMDFLRFTMIQRDRLKHLYPGAFYEPFEPGMESFRLTIEHNRRDSHEQAEWETGQRTMSINDNYRITTLMDEVDRTLTNPTYVQKRQLHIPTAQRHARRLLDRISALKTFQTPEPYEE